MNPKWILKWILMDPCRDCIWIPARILYGSLYGSYMHPYADPIWILTWILDDPFMDHIWIPVWILYGSLYGSLYGPSI